MISERADTPANITLRVLDTLLGDVNGVAVRLWDGQVWGSQEPKVTLALTHPGALREMLLAGNDLAMAEAYLFNDVDIEGNVESLFELADVISQKFGLMSKLGIARELLRLPKGHASDSSIRSAAKRRPAKLTGQRHSIERDRDAVRYHYDVSNDFYALYLDRRMVYSCAYFDTPTGDLDRAQEAKLDLICRKLRLQPGQKLLDLGCGWGGLIIHAAQHYGVDATGITLSQPQADLANERIRAAGLEDRCRVLVRDYREMDDSGPFDVLASIGMFEHVGEKMLPEYFARAHRLLRPGGVFLNHGIARSAIDPLKFESLRNASKSRRPSDLGQSFMDAYVFPDGELVPIHVTLKAAEETGWEIRDVESLREHYTYTLRNWVKRLEANYKRALNYVDEVTYRIWRLYMSGCAYMFKVGRLNLYQTLLSKPNQDGSSNLPLRREDWYRKEMD